jgi:hypothetical protein
VKVIFANRLESVDGSSSPSDLRARNFASIEMETYIGGFLTGANTLAKETDNGTGVALGIGLEDISKSVFRYCAKHTAVDGAEAIMATLLENAKNDEGSE